MTPKTAAQSLCLSPVCRLSEPNLASISSQLEELYMGHSRKDMNTTLTAVVLSACAPDTAMPAQLLMEHVLLVSVLHRTVGLEVGPPRPSRRLSSQWPAAAVSVQAALRAHVMLPGFWS